MAQQQLLGAKKLVNVNFLFTVSIYLAGTFKIYIAPSGIAWCSKYLSTPSGITWW